MRVKFLFLLPAAILLAVPAFSGVPVQVTINGVVEFNQIQSGPLTSVVPGDPATMWFLLDSDLFTDSASFPTRGYHINQPSFGWMLGGVEVGLQDPFPAGFVPYFVIRDNDPAVDGFFLSLTVDFPSSLPTDEPGLFGPLGARFLVTYGQDLLPSLDILDALGTYDFDGLLVYGHALTDGPFDAMFVLFSDMTISLLEVEVPFDVRPGSCPNPLNLKSKGALPAAILGTDQLDVTTIDPASIRLEGVAPLRSDYEDVGTPFEPFTGKADCGLDCNEDGPDGMMDLTLKFDSQEVVAALGDVDDRQCLVVTVTGNLKEEFGGGPILGEDVIVILDKVKSGPIAAPHADRLSRPANLGKGPTASIQLERRD